MECLKLSIPTSRPEWPISVESETFSCNFSVVSDLADWFKFSYKLIICEVRQRPLGEVKGKSGRTRGSHRIFR